MRVRCCEKSDDITIFVTEEDVKNLARSPGYTPVLSASLNGEWYSLMHTDEREYIKFQERIDPTLPSFIKISDDAYSDLLRNRQIGTRIPSAQGNYKINVMLCELENYL
ncbi:MAG: hypothetical protein HZB67_04735 [Candidatus Aenigmarchaeota archaeon]|nr:hypothetical protein [Candidatus Aenigmarchaeota archaeon]